MNFIQYKRWLKEELFKIYKFDQTTYLSDICYYFNPELSQFDYLVSDHDISPFVIKETKKTLTYLRKTKLPIPYLLGFTYFDKMKIFLNKKTFIPRSITLELASLVQEIIQKEAVFSNAVLVDLCSGSGALGFYFKKHFHNFNVICLEKNNLPINASLKNKETLNLDVNIYKSNLLSYLIQKKQSFNILVSNPPYIDVSETLNQSVKHEPKSALYTKKIAIYKKIFKELDQAKHLVFKPFLFAFEINSKFSDLLKKERKKYRWMEHWYFLNSKVTNETVFLIISSLSLSYFKDDLNLLN
ncbi:methyltransferase [Mycoplasma sp. SG1]|uniref:methyltransferase n=1 Tax=Mycoplasma sp. SG1 TaxID=2810348 RepID=UPI0020259466|nr:methyltransferase [Mycoplasma sp. SG1]URM52958.1 methyltransferase [Mycoplasma sp. SG1]